MKTLASILLLVIVPVQAAFAQPYEVWTQIFGTDRPQYEDYYNVTELAGIPSGGFYMTLDTSHWLGLHYDNITENYICRMDDQGEQVWEREVWPNHGHYFTNISVTMSESCLYGLIINDEPYGCLMHYGNCSPSGTITYSTTHEDAWLGAIRAYPSLDIFGQMIVGYVQNEYDYDPEFIVFQQRELDGDPVQQHILPWTFTGVQFSYDSIKDILVYSGNMIFVYFRGRLPGDIQDNDYLIQLDSYFNVVEHRYTNEFRDPQYDYRSQPKMMRTYDQNIIIYSNMGIGKYTPDGALLWFTPLDDIEIKSVDEAYPAGEPPYPLLWVGSMDGDPTVGSFTGEGDLDWTIEPDSISNLSSVLMAGPDEFLVSGRRLVDGSDETFYQGVLRKYSMNPSGIDEGTDPVFPADFAIESVYPNPFNSTITLTFTLPAPAVVSANVFDVLGRLINVPIAPVAFPAGRHEYSWTAKNLTSGTYFLQLDANGQTQTRRVILLK